MSKKLGNFAKRLVKSWGTSTAKRQLWNKEFERGSWDYIDNTPDDRIYGFIEKYANGGSVLDLGCGSGNTGTELKMDAYEHYTGVDISDVAVEKARVRSNSLGRSGKNRYYQSDIFNYAPTRNYDVILFRESIFYVPSGKIRDMLKRYSDFLTKDGVFIVRMCDRKKYGSIVRLIKEGFLVQEEYHPGATSIILVFVSTKAVSS